MRGINKTILIGNAGIKNELKILNSGEKLLNFWIATSHRKKDGSEETEWHNIIAFGRKAEIVNNYLEKGSRVYVEGRIKSSEYTDKEGTKKNKTSIICNDLQILSYKKTENKQNDYIPRF